MLGLRRFLYWLLRSVGAVFLYLNVVALVAAFLIMGVLVLLRVQPITLPEWAVAEIEARTNEALGDAAPDIHLSLGGANLVLNADQSPDIELNDVQIFVGSERKDLFAFDKIRIVIDGNSLWNTRSLHPQKLYISGGEIRLDQGRALNGEAAPERPAQSTDLLLNDLPDLFSTFETVVELPLFAYLQSIKITDIKLATAPASDWTITGGDITVENRAEALRAEARIIYHGARQGDKESAALDAPQAPPAQARMSINYPKGARNLNLQATLNDFDAADIAHEFPVLAWLSVLDTSLSGEILANLNPQGMTGLEANLQLAKGELRPDAQTAPILFDDAKVHLSYEAETGLITLKEAQLKSASFDLEASGSAYVLDQAGDVLKGAMIAAVPAGFLGEIELRDVRIHPDQLFERPLIFTQGSATGKLTLAPFKAEVTALELIEERHRTFTFSGEVSALPDGWSGEGEMSLDGIAHDRLMHIWPKNVLEKTRSWVVENISAGHLTNVTAHVKIDAEQLTERRIEMGFNDVEFRFFPTFPPMENAQGTLILQDKKVDITLEKGNVRAPNGEMLNAAGTSFHVGDVEQKPAYAQVDLMGEGSVPAALSLLNLPPLRFLANSKLPEDVASGKVRASGPINFFLIKRDDPKHTQNIDFDVHAQMSELRSDQLVPGRVLTADDLRLTVTPKGFDISGKGTLSGIGFDGAFSHLFRQKECPKSHVNATSALSLKALKAFGLDLPGLTVQGSSPVRLGITFSACAPPTISLDSDLRGITLEYPKLAVGKDAPQRATFTATIAAPSTQRIAQIDLGFEGLHLRGELVFSSPNAGKKDAKTILERAVFDTARLGSWLDAGLMLRPPSREAEQGQEKTPDGAPFDVFLTSGRLDLREVPTVRPSAQDGKQDTTHIFMTLDEVNVSDSISLTQLHGTFRTSKTWPDQLGGRFSGRINGDAPVLGEIFPSTNGGAVQLRSEDAGAALRASGAFSHAFGGVLDMQIVPRSQPKVYDARVEISDMRVKDASILAEILSLASVVGLLEQLNGNGILFSTSTADLVFSPNGIEVTRANAVGASLGVSLAGLYDIRSKTVDFQGVLSPVYLINGITSALTGNGEGVFGFAYKFEGDVNAPRASVNLLSLLTPGIFRNIFTSPAPRLSR